MGSRVDPEFPSPEEEGAGQHTFHGRMPTLTMVLILDGKSLSSAHGRSYGTIVRKESVLLNPSFD